MNVLVVNQQESVVSTLNIEKAFVTACVTMQGHKLFPF